MRKDELKDPIKHDISTFLTISSRTIPKNIQKLKNVRQMSEKPDVR